MAAKTLTIDDAFSLIGSGNFDRRSFDINYELNMLLFGAEVTKSLRDCQHHYMAGSRPARPDESLPLLPQLARRVERIEARIKLVEEELKGGIDLTRFYVAGEGGAAGQKPAE